MKKDGVTKKGKKESKSKLEQIRKKDNKNKNKSSSVKKVKPKQKSNNKISGAKEKKPIKQSTKKHLENENIKRDIKESKISSPKQDASSSSSMATIKKGITQQIKKQRKPLQKISGKTILKEKGRKYLLTGIPGFDDLFEKGIPKNISLLIAGGAGSGKTIFCLQTLADAASKGEKCLYLSFEESEQRLREHMDDFGWDWKKMEKDGTLRIVRKDPFALTTSVEAMLAKAKGELLIDINEVIDIIPKGFKPDRIAIDSITAIAAAFPRKGEGYRVFIEQLFRYLETLNVTTFLISETEQVPTIFSREGVEEFLADGVIVLYAIKHSDMRENAIEVLKMRGAKHQKNIVAMSINDKGITVYPEQEVFAEIGK